MKIRSTLSILALTAAAGGASLPAAAPAAVPSKAAAVTEFDGKIVSVNRDARRFRIRDLERGTVRIKVTRNTRYERVAGFGGVKKGAVLEVTARRSNGRWVAVEVERSGRDDD